MHTAGAEERLAFHLLAGSEDKCAVVYDLRQGSVLHKLREGAHQDAVSDVAFHPVYPQLATACLDGRVRFYADV